MEKLEQFNNAAATYDTAFTLSEIGKMQRKKVYQWLAKVSFFDKVKTLFEINCGTGFDAEKFSKKGIKVTATDASSSMIEYAKNHRDTSIDFHQLRYENLHGKLKEQDAVFSNFGGLNCVDGITLKEIISSINEQQTSGNLIAMVIMPRFCLMESFYLFIKLKWTSIFRRNTTKAVPVNVDGTIVNTYFHSPKNVRKLIQKDYHIKLVKPVALFLPPSYLEPYFSKRNGLLIFLNKLESIFGRYSFFSNWADHYIIIGEKK